MSWVRKSAGSIKESDTPQTALSDEFLRRRNQEVDRLARPIHSKNVAGRAEPMRNFARSCT
jgi:hypothetical protein